MLMSKNTTMLHLYYIHISYIYKYFQNWMGIDIWIDVTYCTSTCATECVCTKCSIWTYFWTSICINAQKRVHALSFSGSLAPPPIVFCFTAFFIHLLSQDTSPLSVLLPGEILTSSLVHNWSMDKDHTIFSEMDWISSHSLIKCGWFADLSGHFGKLLN